MTRPQPEPPSPTDGDAVVTDHVLDAAPELVWRAVTEPHLVAEWLGPNDLRAEPGARFSVSPEGRPVACEVIEADPPHRLAYSWREAGAPAETVVTFELAPMEAGRTHLRIVHRAADATDGRRDVPTLMTAAGLPARRRVDPRPSARRPRSGPLPVRVRRAA